MARNVDPDRFADCHASGTVSIVAWVCKGVLEPVALCGHCLRKNATHLADTGWTIVGIDNRTGTGVGTESTPSHFALEGQ